MTSPTVTAFFDEATNNASHFAADPETGVCAIYDPLLDYDQATGRTSTRSADAIGAQYLKDMLDVRIGVGAYIREGISGEEFVSMRNAREKTLSAPKFIIPSVQVNMRAGEFPPAEDNGVRYLKTPVDTL